MMNPKSIKMLRPIQLLKIYTNYGYSKIELAMLKTITTILCVVIFAGILG